MLTRRALTAAAVFVAGSPLGSQAAPALKAAAVVKAVPAAQSAVSGNGAAAAMPAAAAFVLDPAKSTLSFVFKQAGAMTEGHFSRFHVQLAASASDASPRSVAVDVELASLDTSDKDRDQTLRGADLFNVGKYPHASFKAAVLGKAGSNAVTLDGTLTLRDVSRRISIPATLVLAKEAGAAAAHLTGEILINRLDYGVGQGEWKSTEWVDNAVKVRFALRLVHP